MFQSFEVTSTPHYARQRVEALRASFDSLGVDAVLVPRGDEFNGEYVPACAERLAWLTGFTGSAGVAMIMRQQAVIFVDGRYVTQLKEQVDQDLFTGGDLVGEPPHLWIPRHAPQGLRLGIDPWLHSGLEVRRLEKALAEISGTLITLPTNPVDALWTDRPAAPMGQVAIQALSQAGRPAEEKIATICQMLQHRGLAAALIADPSSVAWIFNIRGADVPHTPHPLARAILHADGSADLFLDKRKTNLEAESYLSALARQVSPEALEERLAAISAGGAKIMIDPDIASYALAESVRRAGGEVVEGDDPAKLPRAVKNSVELNGSAAAHLQDGAAMVTFLAWLSEQHPGTVSEIQAAQKLEAVRASTGQSMQNPLKDISFDTISGAGDHGAIMHYRVTTESDRKLMPGELFLIDSGAQYINGTTDITRTIAIGAPSEDHRRFFTLVLKGMIQISTARFPKGTRGCDLDPLARIALWRAGVDFGHGTGHGIGSYLSVHEGPQRISRVSTQELLPGMLLSNEPGYYRPGAFGIRIENVLYIREPEAIEGGDSAMLGFETLTLCPIDPNLVLPELLTEDELAWLNAYHEKTRDALLPLITDQAVAAWLERQTRPLMR